MKNKPLLIAVVALLSVVAVIVGYYFLIFLPQLKTQAKLAQDQVSCADMQQKFLSENGENPHVSAINHYNTKLKKCFVLEDQNTPPFPTDGGTIHGDDYTIYDVVENNIIADCSLRYENTWLGTTKTIESDCYDDRNSSISDDTGNYGISITKAQFDSLENRYMTE